MKDEACSGDVLRSNALRVGKIGLVKIWCLPIDNFYLQNKKDVEVVAIQLLGLDSINEGQNFVREKNIHFAVGADISRQDLTFRGLSLIHI